MNGIGLAADGTEHVGYAGFDAEIIHFIVEEKSGTAYDGFGSIRSIECGGYGYCISFAVDHAEVRGFFAFMKIDIAGFQLAAGGGGIGAVTLHPHL